MAYSAPRTWSTGAILTSAQLNSDVRDNMLETAVAKVTTAGDLTQATGVNALARLAAVAVNNALISGGVGVASSWGKITNAHHAQLKYVDLSRAANQSINTATYTAISWDTQGLDPDAWWGSGTDITPQTAGFAFFVAYVRFAGSTAGTARLVRICKGGAAIQPFEQPPAATANLHGVTAFAARSANGTSDVFTVECYQDSGGALNVTAQIVGFLVGVA